MFTMKSERHIFRIAAALALLLSAAACNRLEIPGQGGEDRFDGVPGEPVPVAFHLSVSPMEETPATKTDYEPDMDGAAAGTEAEIKTIQVLQFIKDTEDGDPHWTNVPLFFDHWPLESGESIALTATKFESTIFVIANTAAAIPLSGSVTLDSFLANENFNLIGGTDDVWYSAGGDRYLRMSGSMTVPKVDLGTTVGSSASPLELRRNCAKVVVRVKDSAADVTVESVQLCDVNKKYYYVTDCPGFADVFSVLNPNRLDDAERAYTDGGVAGAGADAGYTLYTYYVPANLRGTVDAVTAQSVRNTHAPHGATRLRVYARYGTAPDEKHVAYTYYLGANLTTDFNLAPNRKYTCTIDITGRLDPTYDSRVEELDETVFRTDANCYLLNPPTRAGMTHTYKIPVRRAAVFWNMPGTNLGLYGADNGEGTHTLTESTEWEAFIVPGWNLVRDKSGTLVSDDALLADAEGQGFNPLTATDPYITVRVDEGMYGNALVAIRKRGTTDILWSWHLWITDYDPDTSWMPEAGTYVYAVPGGGIHRYGGDIWTVGGSTDEYVDGFMMDRNLGALSADNSGISVTPGWKGFYYQWGRKDPFWSATSSYINPGNTGMPSKRNVVYSILHPKTFFSVFGNWTGYGSGSENRLVAGDAVWNDPKASAHAESYNENGKSFYDPCPPGWRVPSKGSWAHFSTSYWNETNTGRNTGYKASVGLYYDPAADGTDPAESAGHMFFPVTGAWAFDWRGNHYLTLQLSGSDGYYWSASPNDATYGACFSFGTSSVTPATSLPKGFGMAVRCVRLH